MINKYAGTCECGSFVAEGEGTVRKVSGKWRISCGECAAPEVQARLHDDVLYWPNGEGYTECTQEYAKAYEDLQDAFRAYEEAGGEGGKDPEVYNAYHTCSDRVARLQGQGGHLGKRVNTPYDATQALLGGGTILVSPNGVVR